MDLEILVKLNSNSSEEKETAHQQDTEEHVMMAWETLDDSMIHMAEEESGNAMKQDLRVPKMMNIIFLVGKLKFQEIMLGGLVSLKISHECKVKMKMMILTILH